MTTQVVDDYIGALNIGDTKLAKRIQAGDFKKNILEYSHIQRFIRNVRILKHTYSMPKTTATVVSFHTTMGDTKCIHGFLHCHTYQDANQFKFTPEYICSGPAFTSQDGEFRSKIIRYSQFIRIFNEFPEVTAMIEDLVIDKMNRGEITFSADYYFPKFCNDQHEVLEDFVDNARVAIKLYIVCWLYDYYQIYYSAGENHMDKNYKIIFSQKSDVPTFLAVEKMLTRREYWHLFGSICDYVPDDVSMHDFMSLLHAPGCGQKICSLSQTEATKAEDINYVVWRELYMTTLCTNLVLNHITPSLPVVINWYYIQNADAKLYDNATMQRRFDHSTIAQGIIDKLNMVELEAYNNQERDFGTINPKFKSLTEFIQSGTTYADSNIVLSDLSVCLILEFVGRTLQDIPKIILAKDLAKDFSYGLSKPFTDFSAFKKTYFEFAYTLFCINTKSQLIHGDLHMNNVTIYQLHNALIDEKIGTHIQNKCVCYMVRDQVYLFPHIGLFAMIIDFSRGIMGDHKKIEHDFGPAFAEMFFRDQMIRMETTIFSHMPPEMLETHKNTIKKLIIDNFALAFKIFTALDILTLTTNMITLFKTKTYLEIGVAPGVEDMLKNSQMYILENINRNLRAVASGQITTVSDIEWPILTFIMRTFNDHVYDEARMCKENISVVDIFNGNNTVKYDITTPDYWGPLIRAEVVKVDIKEKYDEPSHLEGRPDIKVGMFEEWMIE